MPFSILCPISALVGRYRNASMFHSLAPTLSTCLSSMRQKVPEVALFFGERVLSSLGALAARLPCLQWSALSSVG